MLNAPFKLRLKAALAAAVNGGVTNINRTAAIYSLTALQAAGRTLHQRQAALRVAA